MKFKLPSTNKLLFLLLVIAATSAHAQDWEFVGSMNSTAGGPLILLPNGKVLSVKMAAELYDPITKTWTTNGSINTGGGSHTTTLLSNGTVLIAGSTSAVIYDPATGGSRAAAFPMNIPRLYHAAALLPNGKVLVAGGWTTSTGDLSTAELFDPATETWTMTGSMSVALSRGAGAVVLQNGKVLTVWQAANGQIYDPATETWGMTGPMPLQSRGSATSLGNGKVLVAGGFLNQFGAGYFSGAQLFDSATGLWTVTGSMKAARSSHTATLLPDGKVLVTGGVNGIPRGMASTEIYDPISGIWTEAKPLNVARYGHSATLLADGSMLVAGGMRGCSGLCSGPVDYPVFHSSAELNVEPTFVCPSIGVSPSLPTGMVGRTYSHTFRAGSWTAINDLPKPYYIATATLLPDGKVLAIGPGGTSPWMLTNHIAALFDPGTLSWTLAGSMAGLTGGHTATLLPNGKVLTAGGSTRWTNAEIFDPTSGTFASTGSLNFGHRGHIAILLPNGKVLVSGGDPATRNAELYDPATGTWTPTGLMTESRRFHSATLLSNGKVLVAGGYDAAGYTAELYDPATETWTATGSMTENRTLHFITSLPNGKVLVAGGYQSFSDLIPRCELYDPATETWTPTGSMNAKRCSDSGEFGALLPNGNVFVAGNGSPGAEIYNFATESWSGAGAIGVGNPKVIALADGRVLLAGDGPKGELHDPNDSGAVYSYGITGGSLPPGLSFTTNGLLSGVPIPGIYTTNATNGIITGSPTPGTYTFSIAATNASGCSGITECTLIIQDPALELPSISFLDPANNSIIQEGQPIDGFMKDKSSDIERVGIESVSLLLNGVELVAQHDYESYWWIDFPPSQPGWNICIAQATDIDGNPSPPKTNRFYVKWLMPLIITKNGTGSTSMASGYYELAKSYSITATPGAGHLFSNWVATVNGGAPEVVSTSAKYTFIMQSNLTLTANFAPNPFIPAAGKYHALFSETNGVAHQTAGLLALTVRSTLTFGGTLMLDGDKIIISGKFNPDGTATQTISRAKHLKDDLTLTLALDFANDKVFGTISSTGWTSLLEGDKALTAAATNNYTVLLPGFADPTQGPPGYSYGSVRLLATGFVKFSGGTADGLVLSQSLPISKYNRFPVYAPLYKSTKVYADGTINKSYCLGSMFGWIFLTNNTASGTIDWNKTSVTGTLYPNGFSHQASMLGSHYTVPPLSTPAVNFTNGTLTLTNGNLSTALIRNVLVKPNGTIAITPTANAAKFAIARTTGLILGNFQHPDNANKVTTIKGAVLQDHDSVGGYFLGIDQGGLMQVDGN